MTLDPYAATAATAGAPARRLEAVTPHDVIDLAVVAKALFVGTGGDLRILPALGGAAVTLKDHPPGYAPVQTRRVLATGTTAADIVALFD